MTRIINNPIETKVQVLDSAGDPANSATVNFKVFDNSDSQVDSGTMTFIADGIYTCTWTPTAAGEWTVETESTNPKFAKSFTYFVEEGTTKVWKRQAILQFQQNNPTQNQYYAVCNLSGGLKIKYIAVLQTNNENATKNLGATIVIDGISTYGLSAAAFSSGEAKFLYPNYNNSIGFKTYVTPFAPPMLSSDQSVDVMACADCEECHTLVIQLKIEDAPGTNQVLEVYIEYQKIEALES